MVPPRGRGDRFHPVTAHVRRLRWRRRERRALAPRAGLLLLDLGHSERTGVAGRMPGLRWLAASESKGARLARPHRDALLTIGVRRRQRRTVWIDVRGMRQAPSAAALAAV